MRLFLVIGIFLLAGEAFSQRQLVLVKRNFVVSRYVEGDYIRFQRKDREAFTSGIITGIHRDFIKLGEDDTTYTYQIRKIDLRVKANTNFRTQASGVALIGAGALLVLIDLINADGTNIDHATTYRTVAIGFIAAGILMIKFNNNYFKINRRKKIAIQD